MEAVTAGDIQYLLINVPPGMMKSLAVAVFWPAWEWGPKGMASTRYLSSSFSDANVIRDNGKMRRLVASEKYQTLWGNGITFAKDQNAKTKFENTATGNREGRAFGSMTGGRGDRVIIDDPHSVDTAESDTERGSTIQTFREAIPDRLNDMTKSAIVVIMQRLHEDDVAGTILKLRLPYVHLNLPMEYDPKRHCTTYRRDGTILFSDPRTVEGELLFPERFPRKEVEGLKLSKGAYAYCTPAESPILMRDLSLKPIGQVEVGDEVVGFDAKTRQRGKRTHLVPAIVSAISRSVRPVVRITLDSGRVVRCTADHNWFTGRDDATHPTFAPAKIGRPLLRVCEPEMPTTPSEMERAAGWLAGFFDADGSVSLMRKKGGHRASSLVQFTQGSGRNLPLCMKLEQTLDRLGFDWGFSEREPEGRAHCGNYSIRQYYLRGNSLAMFQRFLHVVQPEKWRDRLMSGALGAKFITARERVVSIEPDGEDEVFGLTTTTGTYVVWGLASSNSGQYQQRPVGREGGLFKRAWFAGKIIPRSAVPVIAYRRVRAWDLAGSKPRPGRTPDWTVGLRMLRHGTDYYVEGVDRRQDSPGSILSTAVSLAETDPPGTVIRIPQDPGQAGVAQVESWIAKLAGYSIVAKPPTGSKDVRATPLASQLEFGNVYLVNIGPPEDGLDAWIEPFVDELCSFPNGSNDDQVDAAADAFNELAIGNSARFDSESAGTREVVQSDERDTRYRFDDNDDELDTGGGWGSARSHSARI